jgi:5'-nucleotidase
VAAPFTRDYNAESSLGDLIADAVRNDVPDADFGVVNSGGLRADLHGPDVTFGEVFEILPFDNYVTRIELSGREMQQLFELTLNSEHGSLQVSGLRVVADVSTKPMKVQLFKSDGTPLDPSARYVLATIDFLASGGGGLAPLMKNVEAQRIRVSDRLIRDAAITYLKKIAPRGALQPKVDGRIELRGVK